RARPEEPPPRERRTRRRASNGTQEGARLLPQRPRLERQAPRREGLRRPDGHRWRDHRAPARHPLQAGRRRRHRQGRHDLREGGRHGRLQNRPPRPRHFGRLGRDRVALRIPARRLRRMRRLALALPLAVAALLAASATALADGALLSPATLSDAPAGYLTVAMAPNGYAVAAWNQPLDGGQFAVAVATRPPGGDWSRADLVGASGYDKISPSAAVDASGDVAVAWEEIISFQGHAFVASRAAGGTFPSAEELTDAAAVESPTVGIDASGRVTLLYVPAPALVQREFAAGTSALAAAPQLLHGGGTYGCIGVGVAVAPSGDAVADGYCDNGALFALRRGGTWHVAPVVASD